MLSLFAGNPELLTGFRDINENCLYLLIMPGANRMVRDFCTCQMPEDSVVALLVLLVLTFLELLAFSRLIMLQVETVTVASLFLIMHTDARHYNKCVFSLVQRYGGRHDGCI